MTVSNAHQQHTGARMFRLFMLFYTLAATVLAGSGVVAVLSLNKVDLWSIVVAAAIGAALAVPVAWMVAKRLVA